MSLSGASAPHDDGALLASATEAPNQTAILPEPDLLNDVTVDTRRKLELSLDDLIRNSTQQKRGGEDTKITESSADAGRSRRSITGRRRRSTPEDLGDVDMEQTEFGPVRRGRTREYATPTRRVVVSDPQSDRYFSNSAAPYSYGVEARRYRRDRRPTLRRAPVGTRALEICGRAGGTAGLHPQALANAEDAALCDIKILQPDAPPPGATVDPKDPADCSLIVQFKGTDVLRVVRDTGDMILSSGNWRTLSTRLVLNNCLKPFGLWVEECGTPEPISEKSKDQRPRLPWRVVDGKSYLAMFHDDMVIGRVASASTAQLRARARVIALHLTQVQNNAKARALKPSRRNDVSTSRD